MALREVLTCFIILGFATEVWSHVEIEAEDYFFPLEPVVNFCNIADKCNHYFVPICGQNAEGLTRTFKDTCDMFEYNCDEKQQYRHIKMDVCVTRQASKHAEEENYKSFEENE